MAVRDWTRVEADVIHDFHSAWISELRNILNDGLLPSGYYAMSEQHLGRYIADILTLHSPPAGIQAELPAGGVAVADAPPKVGRKLALSAAAKARRKTLVVRHSSGHRLVALVEIVSPGKKDRHEHVEEFLDKIEDALLHDIHVLLVDLFPPGLHDRRGMHGAIWERLGDDPEDLSPDEPLSLALPEMPLFLDPDYYVNVPLEKTYQTTWRGTAEPWRRVLERPV